MADRRPPTDPELSRAARQESRRPAGSDGLEHPLPGPGGKLFDVPPGVDPRLPRPLRLRVDWRKYSSPPRRQKEVFRASLLHVLLRLFVWGRAALQFLAGTAFDAARRCNTVERRARRLRKILEGAGPTFVKIGQQLSIRVDLLPYEYTHELEKMLDRGPPFRVQKAIEAIEKAAGRPLAEVFQVFDPEPIASASIACVYQALLPNGDRVAIKVRRPNIGRQFAADIRGLSWVLALLEAFWLPPGFTRHFIFELRQMLFEELDFVREARFTDLFRETTRETELDFATSPRVYFELSNHEVLVTEFLTGIFLTELLAAVENKDHGALEGLRDRGIDPELVAKRLIWVNLFGGFEALFFHADLHPGNVLVLPDSKLVLIDFGSCGAFTESERVIWRRVLYAQNRGDVGAMVQATLALLEPLPPIDTHEFASRCETVFWQDLYATRSSHSEWWERTTANVWLGFFRLAREYNIPLRLNTLRMIRGSLLTDTVALRIYPELDHRAEYRRYLQSAGRRARKRLLEKIPKSLFGDAEWIQWEQMFEAGWIALYRAQRFLNSTAIEYSRLRGKFSSFVDNFFRAISMVGFAAAGATVFLAAARVVSEDAADISLGRLFLDQVLDSGWFQVFVLIVVLIHIRRWWYRLELRG